MAGLIIVGIVVVFGFVFVGMYNSFVRLRNRVDEAYATMDAHLKKRWDLIPNLVETVKGYAAHERETLDAVIRARNSAMSAGSMSELKEGEREVAAGLKSIFALAEQYPDLKANTNFVELQRALAAVEDDILQSRRYYNAVVRDLNTKRELFPQSLIAAIAHIEKREFFEIDDSERGNVRVSF